MDVVLDFERPVVELRKRIAQLRQLQAQVLAPAPQEDLVAYAHVAQRDGEIFWTDVEITSPRTEIVARGTVLYRIVS